MGGINEFFVNAIMIMALIAFAKEFPKYLSEITGIKSGNMKLGIKDKLAAGGALTAAAAIGGGITAGVNNFTSRKDRKLGKMQTLGSTVAGATSGFFRSGFAARNAKNYSDVRKSASTGSTNAVNARRERILRNEDYKARNLNAFTGHIDDVRRSVGKWAGVSGDISYYQGENKAIDEHIKALDASKSTVEGLISRPEVTMNDNFWKEIEFKNGHGVATTSNYSKAILDGALSSISKGYDVNTDYSEYEKYFDDVEWKSLFSYDKTNKKWVIGNQTDLSKLQANLSKRITDVNKAAVKQVDVDLSSENWSKVIADRYGLKFEGAANGIANGHINDQRAIFSSMLKNNTRIESAIEYMKNDPSRDYFDKEYAIDFKNANGDWDSKLVKMVDYTPAQLNQMMNSKDDFDRRIAITLAREYEAALRSIKEENRQAINKIVEQDKPKS